MSIFGNEKLRDFETKEFKEESLQIANLIILKLLDRDYEEG
jgi:hypothetical protein